MADFAPARAIWLVCLLLFSSVAAYEFEAVYTADVLGNASGGNETGARYLDNLDLTVEMDIDNRWGLGAGTLFAHVLYNNGTRFSDDLVGDLLVSSNIDASKAWRMFEFWYESGADRWSLRTGLYDLNSEFDVNDLQLVQNSGGLHEFDDAWVIGVHVEVSY